MRNRIAVLFIAVIAFGCGSSPQQTDKWAALGIDYNPTEKVDPRELHQLAAEPEQNARRLMWLISRAAAEKDDQFQYLLKRPGLRKDEDVDLALANYDYSLNGRQECLDYILEKDAVTTKGGDTATVLVMSFVDEWDRTIDAIKEHERHADGAGGIAIAAFWMAREALFPENCRRYKERVRQGEAPDAEQRR